MEFEALGRDVQAQADSQGDSALASAVKSFASWYGLGADDLWRVSATASAGEGASLEFKLVEAGAFKGVVFPSVQTPDDHAAAIDAMQASAVEAPADVAVGDVAAAEAPPADVAEVVAPDPPAASSDASSVPSNGSSEEVSNG